ncbi:hypothetical protein ACERZ8_01540 [Tateyamaria armeniaca]|uniref:Uncharacterized protein n=1 Tax=Tateyamaria armeniaca TaxID=2518930 RepID=A0ABW8UTV0_9RHOB
MSTRNSCIAVAGFALLTSAQGSAGQEMTLPVLVDQCVARYATTCGTAFSDLESYVAPLSSDPNVTLSNSADGSTLVVSRTTAAGGEDGIWERASIAVLGDARYTFCSLDCNRSDTADPAGSIQLFKDAVASRFPGATTTGGDLLDVPPQIESVIWWGSHVIYVRNWTDDVVQPMIATLHEGGLTLHSLRIERAGP